MKEDDYNIKEGEPIYTEERSVVVSAGGRYRIPELINEALPELREITFHTDGKVIVKTGGRAKQSKKLYTGRGKTNEEKITDALAKLIHENK